MDVIIEMKDGKHRAYRAMPDAAGLARILSSAVFVRVINYVGDEEILNTSEIVRVIYRGAKE